MIVTKVISLISVVPNPDLLIIPDTTPTFNSRVTLECQATVVMGLISTLDFEWTRDNMTLQRTVMVNSSMDNPLVYTNSYITPILDESYQNAQYTCVVFIINPMGRELLSVPSNFILTVSSKYIDTCMHAYGTAQRQCHTYLMHFAHYSFAQYSHLQYTASSLKACN